MKKLLFLRSVVTVLLFMVIASCEKPENNKIASEEENVPEEVIVESGPLVLTKAQEGFIVADNTFAVNLLAEMDSLYADEGYFFSPFCISTALSMLLNGTQGETAKEIIDAIGHGDDIDAVNDYYNQILSKSVLWDSTVTLQIANAMISNKNRSIKQRYSNTLKSEYFADVSSFDFSAAVSHS